MKSPSSYKVQADRANGSLQRKGQPVNAFVDNRPQAIAQRKLQETINRNYHQSNPPIQRKIFIGEGKNKIASKVLPKSPDNGVALAIKDRIKQYTGHVPQVYRRLRRWSKSSVKMDFNSWEEAILSAIERVKDKDKDDKVHFTMVPFSPYTPSEQQTIDHLNGPGRTAEHMKPTQSWGELKLHGQIGEYSHQNYLNTHGTNFRDANVVLGYNAPGIDTLSHEVDRCFGQSKMHMADGKTVDQIADEYIEHVENRAQYATTFLVNVLASTPSGEKSRDAIRDLNEDWENKTLTKLIRYFDDEDYQVSKGDLKQLLESSVGEDEEEIHHKLVKLVMNAMHFPVASDVYEQIKKNHPSKIAYFTKLPGTLYSMRKIKSAISYTPLKRQKTKAERKEKEEEEYNEDK